MDNIITAEHAIELIKEFKTNILDKVDWYIDVKAYIKAELLYGSVTKGTNKPDSDIDMLIILPLEIEEKFTTGEYFYRYKGHEINIVLRSIEKLRKLSSGVYDTFQAEVFRDAKIINESDSEVKDLIQRITKAPNG